MNKRNKKAWKYYFKHGNTILKIVLPIVFGGISIFKKIKKDIYIYIYNKNKINMLVILLKMPGNTILK